MSSQPDKKVYEPIGIHEPLRIDLDVVRRQWVKDCTNIRTHWDDCWKVHHECCTERLCRIIEALDGLVEEAS